jgi:lipopolysaccharide export system protein LptA
MSSHRIKAPGIKALLVLLCILPSTAAQAQSADLSQPANIEADRAEFDDLKQVSIYAGNVVFTQGSIRVNADQITLFTREGQLHRLLIEGKPAKFRQLNDAGEEIRAEGFEMEYRADESHLRLEGKAKLSRTGESFSSERIDYDTAKRTVRAGREGATEAERVKIVIQPSRSNKAP